MPFLLSYRQFPKTDRDKESETLWEVQVQNSEFGIPANVIDLISLKLTHCQKQSVRINLSKYFFLK